MAPAQEAAAGAVGAAGGVAEGVEGAPAVANNGAGELVHPNPAPVRPVVAPEMNDQRINVAPNHPTPQQGNIHEGAAGDSPVRPRRARQGHEYDRSTEAPSPRSPGRRDMTAAARSSGVYSRGDNPLYRDPSSVPGAPHSPARVVNEFHAEAGQWARTMSVESDEDEPAPFRPFPRYTLSSHEDDDYEYSDGVQRGAGRVADYVRNRVEDDWQDENSKESGSEQDGDNGQ